MEEANISELCRTCTNKDGNMTLITYSFIRNGIFVNLSDILLMFDVKVQENFSDAICSVCFQTIINVYDFKLQCQKSTTVFESMTRKSCLKFTEKESSILYEDNIEIVKSDIYCKSDGNDCNLHDLKSSKKEIQETLSFSNPYDNENEIKLKGVVTDQTDLFLDGENSASINKPFLSKDCKYSNKIHITSNLINKGKGISKKKDKPDEADLIFCAECNKSFKNKYILITHVRRHQNKGKFVCKVCGKGFNAQSCLSRHTRVHTGEKKYKCEVCHKRFPSANNLNLHSRRHTGIKPYLCTLCGKCFSHPTGLTYHLRTHTKEKPYACDVCGRRFTIQCHKDRHKKTHSGERPFACDLCDKAFIKKFDLQRHKDVHLGNKPYVCHICSKAFVRKMHLKFHIMVHTKERPHVCNYCGKGFIRQYYLTSHIKKHHPYGNNNVAKDEIFDENLSKSDLCF